MNSLKTVLVFMMMGALLGVIVASLTVPRFLMWYNEPGAIAPGRPVETLCNLPDLIKYASDRLIRGQLIGAIVGALLFMVPGIMTVRRRTVPVTEPTVA